MRKSGKAPSTLRGQDFLKERSEGKTVKRGRGRTEGVANRSADRPPGLREGGNTAFRDERSEAREKKW